MAGRKGKSGGQRDGAGRPRSKITIKVGDQFYSPMRGLATVVEIGAHRLVIEIDGDRIILDGQSHAAVTSSVTSGQLRERASVIAENTSGNWVERRYIVRNILVAEFGIDANRAEYYARGAVKKNG